MPKSFTCIVCLFLIPVLLTDPIFSAVLPGSPTISRVARIGQPHFDQQAMMLHASSFPVRNGNPRDPSVWVRYFAGAFFRPGAVPGTLPYGSILGNRWVAFAPFWESVLEVPVLNVFVVAAIALCRKPVEPPAYLVTMGLMGGAFILGAVSLSQGDWMLRVFLTGVWGLACGAFLAPAHVEATQEEKSILRPVLTFFALARLFPFMFSPALPPEWVPTVSALLPDFISSDLKPLSSLFILGIPIHFVFHMTYFLAIRTGVLKGWPYASLKKSKPTIPMDSATLFSAGSFNQSDLPNRLALLQNFLPHLLELLDNLKKLKSTDVSFVEKREEAQRFAGALIRGLVQSMKVAGSTEGGEEADLARKLVISWLSQLSASDFDLFSAVRESFAQFPLLLPAQTPAFITLFGKAAGAHKGGEKRNTPDVITTWEIFTGAARAQVYILLGRKDPSVLIKNSYAYLREWSRSMDTIIIPPGELEAFKEHRGLLVLTDRKEYAARLLRWAQRKNRSDVLACFSAKRELFPVYVLILNNDPSLSYVSSDELRDIRIQQVLPAIVSVPKTSITLPSSASSGSGVKKVLTVRRSA